MAYDKNQVFNRQANVPQEPVGPWPVCRDKDNDDIIAGHVLLNKSNLHLLRHRVIQPGLVFNLRRTV